VSLAEFVLQARFQLDFTKTIKREPLSSSQEHIPGLLELANLNCAEP